MSVSLVKGEKINLSKEVAGLAKVKVAMGWDAAKKGVFGRTSDIDCDASVLVIGTKDEYLETVYYGRKIGAKDCIKHHGDNRTGIGVGDDETISIDLKNMPANVGKLAFVVNIYDCVGRRQNFGMIKNAYIRLIDVSNNKEICRYNLSDGDYDDKTAMIFGEVYKRNNEWKFSAMGRGTSDTSINDLIRRYK